MSINFKKLKSQMTYGEYINGEKGWFFKATKEQEEDLDLYNLFFAGRSKRKSIKVMVEIIQSDGYFATAFKI